MLRVLEQSEITPQRTKMRQRVYNATQARVATNPLIRWIRQPTPRMKPNRSLPSEVRESSLTRERSEVSQEQCDTGQAVVEIGLQRGQCPLPPSTDFQAEPGGATALTRRQP